MKLLVNGVPTDLIIEHLTENFVKRNLSEKVKTEVISWAAFYDNR